MAGTKKICIEFNTPIASADMLMKAIKGNMILVSFTAWAIWSGLPHQPQAMTRTIAGAKTIPNKVTPERITSIIPTQAL